MLTFVAPALLPVLSSGRWTGNARGGV